MKKLKVGEISGLVKTLYGFHIIKLTAFEPPRQLEFDEVREDLRSRLLEEQRSRLYSGWIGTLKSECRVEHVVD